MAETFKVLAQSAPAAATLTDAYTVPAAKSAVVSTITVANRSATSTTIRISVAVAGAANTNAQYIAYDVALSGNETKGFTIGVTLGALDVIRVYATLATVSFNVFGSEITA